MVQIRGSGATGGRHTGLGFQSPKTFGEVGKEVLGEEWQEGGPSLILLPTIRRSVDSSWRVLKNRPNHVQKVLGTIPVLSDDKEKTRLAASSTPRYPQSPPLTSTWFDTAEEVT